MRSIVIGAGVLGASTAFHLASSGVQVTIIDATLDGRATAAGAGIICPWISGAEDAAFLSLYTSGAEYYPEIVMKLAEAGVTDPGYRRTGAMLVTGDLLELRLLDRMTRSKQVAAMGAVTCLAPAEARCAFPLLRPDLSGIHIEGGARVDGRRLAGALLAGAVRFGAEVRQGIAKPVVANGRVEGVTIEGGSLAADVVVVTAGAWGDAVLKHLDGNLPVEPQRGQIVHLHLPDTNTEGWPVILPPGSHYIVPFDEGRIVAGATRESGAGFDYRITAAGQHEVLTEALNVAPGLASATLVETRIGFRPTSASLRPILGWFSGIEGLALGNGLGAAGLTIGPFAGRLLAELILGRRTAIELTPFGMNAWREKIGTTALR